MKSTLIVLAALCAATFAQSQTQELFCSSSVTGSIDGGESAIFPFIFEEGGHFTITTCNNGTNFDTVLEVYRDANLTNQVVENDDDFSCPFQTLFSTVDGEVEPNGGAPLFVVVRAFGTTNVSISGDFQLSVSCNESPSQVPAPGPFTETHTPTPFNFTEPPFNFTEPPAGGDNNGSNTDCALEVEVAEWRLVAQIAEILARADADIADVRARVQTEINALID